MAHRDWQDLTSDIALVATDLDGTLIRSDQTVSDFTIDTFRRARAQDLPIIFVTGRPPRWMAPVAEATQHHGLAVCANGALVIDLVTQRVVESDPISPEVIDEIVTTLRAEVPGVAFAAEWADDGAHDESFGYEPTYVTRYENLAARQEVDVREFTRGKSVVKLLARSNEPHDHVDTFLGLAATHIEHLADITHSDSTDTLLEMSAYGVSKGSTLARLAGELGIGPANVAAAGDMPNDVSMIRWAGAGLGIQDGHDWVIEAADALIPGPHDDGIARFVAAALDKRL
jgi:Cof subfamily protein (haloacid dehalogenase superfamily)